ncbi:tRNA methyltransferase 44 [Apophysomyces ossiformis]|uniref:tRNA (uracil-O(2)-)-methyltransferase n=1 Tax=Apophysomyces ossiformis TaxID=679940 RepID=A0A8H7ERD9_9FUNG|nr:tRNA methyltransferase 44 [Apophysomyces ossiformis]
MIAIVDVLSTAQRYLELRFRFIIPSGTLRLDIVPLTGSHAAVSDTKMQYALKTLLHKLFKWCIQARIGYKKKAHHDVLVPKDAYIDMYQHVKQTYATELINNWTEKTDPTKFVFEDIAIASYLICLWKEEEKRTNRKPRFVDLACGNGLLTYLLTSEGYEGYGIDMAERKIWSMLRGDKEEMLRVETLYPSQLSYPQADWLIGNHADELVPWIPIIASKSGDHCKSLALRSEEGKYRAYTNYIKDLGKAAGYVCEEDYLRIPSTKNIAIVGRQRRSSIDPETWQKIEAAGLAFVPRKTDREKDMLRRDHAQTTPEQPPNGGGSSSGGSSGGGPVDPSPSTNPSTQPTTPQTTNPPPTTTNPPPTTTQPPPTTTNPPPTTTNPPSPSATTTTTEPPRPTTTTQPPTTTVPPITTTTQPSTRTNPPTTSSSNTSNSDSSSTPTSRSSSSTSSSTETPTSTPVAPQQENHVGTIVGAVIGGVVGVALIGGALTFLNRRGGCARRSEKRTADFEDFGLAETDFPHHRSPPMATAGLAAAGAGGAAAVAGTQGGAKGSPTLPRLNAQGNYYDPAGHQYMPSSYQPQLDMNQAEYGDYPTQHAAGAMAAQQGYYYPQQQHQEGGYYDEHGYYYDGSTAVPSPGYDHSQPAQHQQAYPPHPPPGDYYKPDQVDAKPHQHT